MKLALDDAVAAEQGTGTAAVALMAPHSYEASPLRKKQRPSDQVSGLKDLASHAVTVQKLTSQQLEQAESILVSMERDPHAMGDITHQYQKHAEAVNAAVKAAAERQQDVCQHMLRKLELAARNAEAQTAAAENAAARAEAEAERASKELQELHTALSAAKTAEAEVSQRWHNYQQVNLVPPSKSQRRRIPTQMD